MSIFWDRIDCVFLDRDGVLNRKAMEGEYVSRWEDFHLLPGAAGAIARLNASGRRVFVVSNQRGVALGKYSAADVETLHASLQSHLALDNARIDAFYFCPHDVGECSCRKPQTGMLRQAFDEFPDANPANSVLIGDSLSDIQAARNAGMCSIFIRGDAATRKAGGEMAEGLADACYGSLAEAIAAAGL